MFHVKLLPNERLDDLQNSGCHLIQRVDGFRFGTDSVVLADFAAPRKKDLVAELCSGSGAIAHLMVLHNPHITVDCVEIQPDIADMCRRSVEMNGLTARIIVHNADLRACRSLIGAESRTLVVCNPPYGRSGCGLVSENDSNRISRHEDDLTPDELCKAASGLLRSGGRFAVIYPTARAFELMTAMANNRLAPKRVRAVSGMAGKAPKTVLIEAVKDGGEGLHWLPELVLRHQDGTETDECRRIYGETESFGHMEN